MQLQRISSIENILFRAWQLYEFDIYNRVLFVCLFVWFFNLIIRLISVPLFSQPVGFLILGYCLCLFSLSLYLIGFVAPFWVKVNSVSSVTYTFGLWRYCRKSADSTICAELQKTNGEVL